MGYSYDYELGLTIATLFNAEQLFGGCHGEFTPCSVTRVRGDGIVVGDGHATATWYFDYLTRNKFTSLISWCSDTENPGAMCRRVYIHTRKDTGIFEYYSAIIHRPRIPEDATPVFGGFRDVKVLFTHLVLEIVVPGE